MNIAFSRHSLISHFSQTLNFYTSEWTKVKDFTFISITPPLPLLVSWKGLWEWSGLCALLIPPPHTSLIPGGSPVWEPLLFLRLDYRDLRGSVETWLCFTKFERVSITAFPKTPFPEAEARRSLADLVNQLRLAAYSGGREAPSCPATSLLSGCVSFWSQHNLGQTLVSLFTVPS